MFHTWEFVVDRSDDLRERDHPRPDGKDRWVEVCRTKTAPTYLERLDLQLDYALKAKEGLPKTNERQDFIVDWIEVLQKTTAIEAVGSTVHG
ncbi:MAG: hypothetical protein ACOX3C_05935 [Bacilli bacterium]